MIVVDGPEIARFIERALKVKIAEPYFALGFMSDDKKPLAAFVFNDFTGANIELTAVSERGRLGLEIKRYIARYVFIQNGCRRLTVRTKKRNKRVLKLAPLLGFKYEGVQKHFYADDDAVVFGMLKEDCRFL